MSRLLSRILFRPLGAAAWPVARSAPWKIDCRLAGHSRWQNVRSDKEAGMAQKRSLMTNYLRLLRKAIIDGNGSTSLQANVHLKAVFDRAKADNVPLKTLEKMLASKTKDGVEPYVVEVRGRGGICLLVQCNSSAKTKSKQDVTNQVKRIGLEVVGIDSSVSKSFFDKKGSVEVSHDPVKLSNLDQATELALEFDCADVRFEDGDSADGGGGVFVFECAPASVDLVAEGLRSSGLSVLDASVRYEPFERVELDSETLQLLNEMIDRIREQIDGVVQVFDNVTEVGGNS